MVDRWPELAPHDEKVRRLFDEFDSRGRPGRGVDLDAWTDVFHKFHLGFSAATCTDLFEKADMNGDRLVDIGEWQRFAELYPTLVDCCYYRARDWYTDAAQRDGIDAAKDSLAMMREHEAHVRAARAAAQQETDGAGRGLEQQQAGVADAAAAELSAKAALDAAHDDVEAVRADLQARVQEQQQHRDLERQRGQELAEAQRAAVQAGRRAQAAEQDAVKVEQRLHELERLLLEQQREAERARVQCDQARQEVGAARALEQDCAVAEEEARRDGRAAGGAVGDAEAEVHRRQERERGAGHAVREAAAEVARRAAQRDAALREVEEAQARERQREAEEAAAAAAVDEQERGIAAMEAENADFQNRRRVVDDEEQPLLDQEVRLREQRESLESKEQKLRSDFERFTGRAPRPGAPGAGSADPPTDRHYRADLSPARRYAAAATPDAAYPRAPSAATSAAHHDGGWGHDAARPRDHYADPPPPAPPERYDRYEQPPAEPVRYADQQGRVQYTDPHGRLAHRHDVTYAGEGRRY